MIKFANSDDSSKIKNFIHKNWKKNHILVRSKELFDWQHKNSSGYNFVMCENNNNEITSLFGFIPVNKFDKNLNSKSYFGAIWKSTNKSLPGEGFYLINFFLKKKIPDFLGFVGITENAKRIYKSQNWEIGTLNHYYIVNKKLNKFHLIKNPVKMSFFNESKKEKNLEFKEIFSLDDIQINTNHFQKIKRYIRKRYSNHPIYKYRFFGFSQEKEIKLFFVFRNQKFEDSSCINIIEIFGQIDYNFNYDKHFHDLMINEDLEYIDCLNFGLSESFFYKLGFSKKNSSTVIPTYFEPFVKKNITIDFCTITSRKDYIIFKGDGDQDRPNFLKNEY